MELFGRLFRHPRLRVLLRRSALGKTHGRSAAGMWGGRRKAKRANEERCPSSAITRNAELGARGGNKINLIDTADTDPPVYGIRGKLGKETRKEKAEKKERKGKERNFLGQGSGHWAVGWGKGWRFHSPQGVRARLEGWKRPFVFLVTRGQRRGSSREAGEEFHLRPPAGPT